MIELFVLWRHKWKAANVNFKRAKFTLWHLHPSPSKAGMLVNQSQHTEWFVLYLLFAADFILHENLLLQSVKSLRPREGGTACLNESAASRLRSAASQHLCHCTRLSTLLIFIKSQRLLRRETPHYCTLHTLYTSGLVLLYPVVSVGDVESQRHINPVHHCDWLGANLFIATPSDLYSTLASTFFALCTAAPSWTKNSRCT